MEVYQVPTDQAGKFETVELAVPTEECHLVGYAVTMAAMSFAAQLECVEGNDPLYPGQKDPEQAAGFSQKVDALGAPLDHLEIGRSLAHSGKRPDNKEWPSLRIVTDAPAVYEALLFGFSQMAASGPLTQRLPQKARRYLAGLPEMRSYTLPELLRTITYRHVSREQHAAHLREVRAENNSVFY